MACGNAPTLQNGTYKPGDTSSSYGDFLISAIQNSADAKLCADFYISGNYDKTKVEAKKQSIRNSYETTSDSRCSTSNAVGTCAIVSNGSSSVSTTVITFYSPISASDAKSSCSSAGGTYK